ncbi:oxygen-independent coproporphyrinogen III oxidase [Xanthomonas massiliensis]|uniref:oxygen-independent coproporphyrinogen III oxidase n=1 Tax=Xanthomonas massiliensis TaxID=1720302 RepID=UPI0011CC63A4|nr:oxygen-independent coproporphyrinogen III oxidase [Xanthomonas massiliensis]
MSSPQPLPLTWQFDPDLLRRYDRPGPRYTSYPTAPHFHDGFGAHELRQAALRSRLGHPGRQLSLYVHVPYCRNPCFYCGCNRVITRDARRGLTYLEHLLHEAALVAPLFGGREVIQLHLGGGTPNFLAPQLLADLVEGLGRLFRFSGDAGRDFSIELDPRSVQPEDVARLAQIGFNRASLGIQDFDPQVQRAINREQGVAETMAVIEACRRHGMHSVNVDLIYGLPRQTPAGFGRTLDTVIAARPDRLAVYGYAHLPNLFKAQRQIHEEDLPDAEGKLALLGLAVRKLSDAGYQYIGMDHFALPGEDLAVAQREGGLHRNFMGYTTHADTDLVGLGVSAISHVGDSYSQNPRDLPGWEAALAEDRIPAWRGVQLSADDLLRAELIQQLMCQGRVDLRAVAAAHGVDAERAFAAELEAVARLQRDGLADYRDGVVSTTAQGRPLLRLLAMCFDAYLRQPDEAARYSKAI